MSVPLCVFFCWSEIGINESKTDWQLPINTHVMRQRGAQVKINAKKTALSQFLTLLWDPLCDLWNLTDDTLTPDI